MLTFVLKSMFRAIQIGLHLSESRKSLEMKRCLQSCMVPLGFSWTSSTTLNPVDNLWCECIWNSGEKWAQCQFRNFPTCYCPDCHGHILSKWIVRFLGELMQGTRPNHFIFRSTYFKNKPCYYSWKLLIQRSAYLQVSNPPKLGQHQRNRNSRLLSVQ